MKSKLKIVIADDHILYRKWLKLLLRNIESAEISGEAQNGEEAVNLALATNPDLVILDYEMPVMNGIDAADKIHNELPGILIMMLTVYKESNLKQRAEKAGIQEFLEKESAEHEILKVIQKIIAKANCDNANK